MRKTVLINLFIAGMLIFTIPISIIETFKKADRYGWRYEETVTIGAHSEVREIWLLEEIFAGFILTFFVSTLIFNTVMISRGLSIQFQPNENLGITFPSTEPEHWHVEGDIRGGKLDVKLGEYVVRIPYDKIKTLFGSEET